MLVSVITINYNNLPGLKRTMASVMEQTYPKIEYILIDGGSTDGSREYLAENEGSLGSWLSEKDDGIYDAMNKGIDRASGDYLLFLNSGDWLVNKEVIAKFVAFDPKEDLVYGNTLLMEHGRSKVLKMPANFSIGTALTHTLNHQAIFFRRSLFEDGSRYDCSYKIVADWVFVNRAVIEKKCSTRHIDLLIPCYDAHGVSNDKEARIAERQRFLKENFSEFFLDLLEDYKRSLQLPGSSVGLRKRLGKLGSKFRK